MSVTMLEIGRAMKLGGPVARKARSLFSRFRRDRKGVAAIEFAMVVPIMSLLFIGAIEFSQALTVDRRVTQAASSTADLIARSPSTGMTAADVDGALKIIEQLIQPYSLAQLTVKIVSVRANANGTAYTVDWSRDNKGGTPYARGASYSAIPAGLIGANETVVVGEAIYNYTPLIFKYFITSAFDLQEKFYLKPRNAACVILKPTMTTC